MPRLRRIQVLVDPELDDWLESRARSTKSSKSALVREALAERKAAEDADGARRVDDFLEYLRAEVWRHVPADVRRNRTTTAERETLLGIGPEGH